MSDICVDSNCKRYVNCICEAYGNAGMVMRKRLGYCPIPDWPRREVKVDHVRVGQQHQKVKKKK